ncbi:hypothetical protein [Liquorilactobacillus uvarum]|uniref:Uncharacterized protein n=1 Tax=Liquorilactobacillus uvarum DSM 19971 TaxID=1423812 RepID=A0A0R1PUJ8_9LACO|nr:hypothetical protein [Liquorilactobacillus uvarum]KRL33924.1 hypothetical protein FD20_GL001796 [Liquorilactobacillus uvarum DSM 19971]
MSNHWKVTIKASAKGDLKKILKSPLCKSFEEIKMYWKLTHTNQYSHLKNELHLLLVTILEG